jgi:hypothetical protein
MDSVPTSTRLLKALTPMVLNYSIKYKGKECYHLLWEANIILIPKADKNMKKKKKRRRNYRLISLKKLIQKFSIRISQTEFNNILKRLYTMIRLVLFHRSKDGFTYVNQ